MSSEAMIERFHEIRHAMGAVTEPIEVALENGKVVFSNNSRTDRAIDRSANVAAGLLLAALTAWGIVRIWHAQRIGWWAGFLIVVAAAKVSRSAERRLGKLAGQVIFGAIGGLAFVLVFGDRILLSKAALSAAVMGLLVGFCYNMTRMPRDRTRFEIDPERREISVHKRFGDGRKVPIDDIEYFLACRTHTPDTDLRSLQMSNGLFAVEADGQAHHLLYGSVVCPAEIEQSLRILGHVCQKPVLALDDFGRWAAPKSASGFALARDPEGALHITNTDRETLFEAARVVYRPGMRIMQSQAEET